MHLLKSYLSRGNKVTFDVISVAFMNFSVLKQKKIQKREKRNTNTIEI